MVVLACLEKLNQLKKVFILNCKILNVRSEVFLVSQKIIVFHYVEKFLLNNDSNNCILHRIILNFA